MVCACFYATGLERTADISSLVTFTSPVIGERALNFNEEGFVHLGLVPELIEDMRGGGRHDEEIEALFRSAEGYLRMWERAEVRARTLE